MHDEKSKTAEPAGADAPAGHCHSPGTGAGGDLEMKPKPPCGRNCPKRSAVPNCHDPAVCGDWAAYQDALAKWNEDWKAARKSRDDYKAAKSQMRKIYESRERDRP